MNKRLMAFIPLGLFLGLCFFLWRGLSLDPKKLPSPLLNKPMPRLDLSRLSDQSKRLTQADFIGRVSLLNVWATWCIACREEHQALLDIARSGVTIYGFDYKDSRKDALQWLSSLGSPYKKVGVDVDGRVAINWGVYGAPETFLIDKHGVVRYKHVGIITPDLWQKTLSPIYEKLEAES